MEALRAFLQHTLVHRPDVVASLRPSDDPSFTVGGEGEAMAAAVHVYDDDNDGGVHSIAGSGSVLGAAVHGNGVHHKADVLAVVRVGNDGEGRCDD